MFFRISQTQHSSSRVLKQRSKWITSQWHYSSQYLNIYSKFPLSGVCPSCCLLRGFVWLVWPCQMAWWTAWIPTAVCRQPVTPPPCVWALLTPWTSSRRHRCPLHRATCRLSTNECTSWWAGTAPTSSLVPTPLMESKWHVQYISPTPTLPSAASWN